MVDTMPAPAPAATAIHGARCGARDGGGGDDDEEVEVPLLLVLLLLLLLLSGTLAASWR